MNPVTARHVAEGRVPWLDVCRALAILLVLLSHGRVFLRPAMPWTDYFRFGGFMGVELFFALSGFLIGGILIRSSLHGDKGWLKRFYARRWLRTLPNYYLFLAINIGLVWLAVRPGSLGDAWKYVLFTQNLFWPHPLFFPEAWSLAVEEVFYLLFPVLFLLTAPMLRLTPQKAILVVAIAVIVASLVARAMVADSASTWDEEVRKLVLLRADSLMFGVLLAWLHEHRSPWLRQGWLVAAAVLAFAATSAYFALTPDAVLNTSFFAKTLFFSAASVGCAGVVIVGIQYVPPRPIALAGRYLARISYSAYLVNLPVAMTLAYLVECCDGSWQMSLGLWFAFMTFTLGISHLVYRLYESPINAIRDRYFSA